MKHLALLGSTGSIGQQTLELVRRFPDKLCIECLAANSNVELLEQQAREFHPSLVCVYRDSAAAELKVKMADTGIRIVSGMDGLVECATWEPVTMTVTAVVGMIGIRPTIAAIEAGKEIALANKETLVTAGHLIAPLLETHHLPLYPIDSEHSAIYQSLQTIPGAGDSFMQGHPSVQRILLTASGGPFLGKTKEEMESFTVEDALKHPNWSMGRKITVDSASMVNKGLEMMEARWLFGLRPDQIQVVIHPQSILHSAVEFIDGAVIGQMGTPDMRLPIEYAICYPYRQERIANKLDLFTVGKMEFFEPDYDNFPAFAMAKEVLMTDYSYGAMTGTTLPTVFNAANEFAVAKFLNHQCGFGDISRMISDALKHHKVTVSPTLSEILEAEAETYRILKG